MTDRELLPILYEAPWFELDLATKKILRRYICRHEEDPDADMYYNISANDDPNSEETKAFLKTKVTDPTQEFREVRLHCGRVIGWDNVQLSDMAIETVEVYMGRPLDPQWPTYDDGKVPVIKDSDWK
jgi:hypothetical protein